MLKLGGEKIVNELIARLARSAGGTQKYVPKPGVWQFFDDELEEFVKLVIKEAAVATAKSDNVEVGTMDAANDSSNSSAVVFKFDAYKNIINHFNLVKRD